MEKIRKVTSHNETVVTFLLDDGKGNILDHQMMEQLCVALVELKKSEQVKLVVFEGAGKNFSFGASVEEHVKDAAATMLKTFHQLFYTIRELAIPTLSKVSGQCLGGGMELAIMCNFIYADKTAKFGQPEIVLGVFPPPASIILPEKIGLARAEDLLITGRTISAEKAQQFGLVNEVLEDRTVLDAYVEEWIVKYIQPKSASSLRFAVKASRVKFNHVLGNFLPVLENMYVNGLMETRDASEGINSFLEKRSPVWSNN